jgi:hypothetical protein
MPNPATAATPPATTATAPSRIPKRMAVILVTHREGAVAEVRREALEVVDVERALEGGDPLDDRLETALAETPVLLALEVLAERGEGHG